MIPVGSEKRRIPYSSVIADARAQISPRSCLSKWCQCFGVTAFTISETVGSGWRWELKVFGGVGASVEPHGWPMFTG